MEGLAELTKNLQYLPKTTAKNTIRRVLKERAKPVQEAWQQRTPKLTGDLERSIVVGTKLTRRQAREAKKDGTYFSEIHIGTADPAGVQTEFGNEHQPAHPAGRPAWEATQDAVLIGIGEDFEKAIVKSLARIAKKAGR